MCVCVSVCDDTVAGGYLLISTNNHYQSRTAVGAQSAGRFAEFQQQLVDNYWNSSNYFQV